MKNVILKNDIFIFENHNPNHDTVIYENGIFTVVNRKDLRGIMIKRRYKN